MTDDVARVHGYAAQFADNAQRRHADTLGMWLFLATELMMFGGLFLAIAVYRWLYPVGVREAARHLHMWIGAGNTAILLTSSLAMAIAATAARLGQHRVRLIALAATAVLGVVFLAVKAVEYSLEVRDGVVPGIASSVLHSQGAQLFINLYFLSTGLHAIHLTIGIVWIAILAATTRRAPADDVPVVVAGLYWHFVDVIWVFLYPALYLVGRTS